MESSYKRSIKEVVVKAEKYDSDFPPSNLMNFRSWLNEMIENIPDEFQSEAAIEITAYSEYDSAYLAVEIAYFRPETDAEMAQRKRAEENMLREQERIERKRLAELQAKYGEKP